MSLYLKYRPKTLNEIIGNKPTVEALQSILSRGAHELPHALLFTGPSGCGKTTLARIVAKELGVSDLDFTEVDVADFRGIDTIRDIRRQMNLRPIDGPVKVWLMDEVHMLGKEAQNAFLKALEDTPKHVYFILATTDPQKLLKTIISRCMQFEVSALPQNRIMKLLRDVVQAEGKSVSERVLELIARESLGSPRVALVVLDKVIDSDPRVQEKAVEIAAIKENATIELCKALLNGEKWPAVSTILKGLQEQEPESIRRAVLGYFSAILISSPKIDPRVWMIIDAFRHPTYDNGWPSIVLSCAALVKAAER